MQKHLDLTLQRIQSFATERGLFGKIYTDRAPVKLNVFSAPGRISYTEAMKGSYQPAIIGQQYGPFWSTHWFRIEIDIPTAWTGREVHLLWDSSSEAEVWQDSKPMQGLTGSGGAFRPGVNWGPVRPEYILTRKAQGGESFVLYIEMAVNNLFGLGYNEPERLEQVGMLRQAEIASFDRQAWDMLWDYKVIADMALELPASTPRGGQALFNANQMVNQIDLEDRQTWADAQKLADEYYAAHNGDGQFNLSAIGHAHIDTAWLWPLAETRRKCARSFSSAVLLMDEYPDFRFACSQAQQYEWIKEDYPDLYERIKQKVKSGQFIPAGGTWVEPDCNLPSGEALVRQFLYGQRFFRREFGVTCQEFWEPDVFGYSAALPQIMRQVGMKYFLTIKLSWNQFNRLSSHTFWWEGLDGSRVLTHFPPANIYEGNGTAKEVLYSMTNYKDLDRSTEAYYLFGFGDGGGGPTRPMLEQLKRMHDVDGLPRVEIRSPLDFFTRLEANSQDLLTWVGELYFELHRGTYTTQANNKKYNRQSEFLLHDVEFLSAIAHASQGLFYPTAEIDRLWKLVLTNQFHDIIPGSSIDLVYQDSNAHYQDVLGSGAALRNQALVALNGKPEPQGLQVCVVNTTGFERSEVVELPIDVPAAQSSAGGKSLGIAAAPAYGFSVFNPSTTAFKQVAVVETGDRILLENEYVRAELHRDGSLASLFDKRAGRESIQPGQAANRFILFDDQPNNWDAWDVDVFHLEKHAAVPGAISCRVVEHGPLRGAIAFEYDLGANSRLSQTVMLSAVSPRLDFNTEVEWHERHKFLKVEFPLYVRAMNATYETQFGHLQRPTHFNTSWDMARFEVIAHKWADLSDSQFGVALLNDCKYGHATHGNIMRLSLLRSPTAPDPEADQGHHIFRYALLPHPGSPQAGGVIEEGYRFNSPLLVYPTAAAPIQHSFFSLNNPAIVLDTVKKAEDSNDIILRLYEAHGSHGTARLLTSLPVASVRRCNLLEDDDDGNPTPWPEGGFPFAVKPFEILTLKLSLKPSRT
jgi:alpha-mannosidase